MADVVRVAGIFVGGRATRMGGAAKGLLRAPDGSEIAARLAEMLAEVADEVVLVGGAASYVHLGREAIADEISGIGPLGGLIALLRRAREGAAIAVACDMPYVSRALVLRLATHASDAAVVAPRQGDRWQPMFARYDAARTLPVAIANAEAGRRSLQALLDRAGVDELVLTDDESAELRDWDTPDDVRR
jgi:molybdopterin-guanine dinucleotide biosynthesis protein A